MEYHILLILSMGAQGTQEVFRNKGCLEVAQPWPCASNDWKACLSKPAAFIIHVRGRSEYTTFTLKLAKAMSPLDGAS